MTNSSELLFESIYGQEKYLVQPPHTFYCILYGIHLLYGIPSIFVNCYVMKATFRLAKKQPFFIFFNNECLLGSITFVLRMLNRLPLTGLFPAFWISIPSGFHINIYYILPLYFGYLLYYSTVVLCFNRFTAIFFPFQYDKWWKRGSYPLLLFMYLLPTTTTFQLLPATVVITTFQKEGGYILYYETPWNFMRNSWCQAVACSLSGLLGLSLTVSTWLRLRSSSTLAFRQSEKTLFVVAAAILVSNLAQFTVQIGFYLIPKTSPSYNRLLLAGPFVTDIASLASPWAILPSLLRARGTDIRSVTPTASVVPPPKKQSPDDDDLVI